MLRKSWKKVMSIILVFGLQKRLHLTVLGITAHLICIAVLLQHLSLLYQYFSQIINVNFLRVQQPSTFLYHILVMHFPHCSFVRFIIF